MANREALQPLHEIRIQTALTSQARYFAQRPRIVLVPVAGTLPVPLGRSRPEFRRCLQVQSALPSLRPGSRRAIGMRTRPELGLDPLGMRVRLRFLAVDSSQQ